MNKLCSLKCPYSMASFQFIGGAIPLRQTGKYKCHWEKNNRTDNIPKECPRKLNTEC